MVECKLVAKQGRGNRTNVYLVYPPEYYRENKPTVEQGVDRTPPNDHGRVSREHPESVEGTPSGCREDTLRVSTGHPKNNKKNNNKNNKEKSSLKRPPGEEESIAEKGQAKNEKERKNEGTLNSVNTEAVHRLFKAKGYQVGDKVIASLLGGYPFDAIKAVIQNTDFHAARNPLAVIKWALSTGSYMIPVPKVSPAPPPVARAPDPIEETLIRQMIREAKASLRGKPCSLAGSVTLVD